MRQSITLVALLVLAAMAAAVDPAAAQNVREERVEFAGGAISAKLTGTIAGDEVVDYVLRATAGQVMKADLETSNASLYFNVTGPGAARAMFIGSTEGTHFEGALAETGDQVLRLYLMRNAARRGEQARYELTIALTSAAAPAADYADGMAGGPDFWAVTGLPQGDTLNVRAGPSTRDPVLTELDEGAVVRNLGCRKSGDQKWCEVARPDDSGRGWVAGRYLRETAPPGAPSTPPQQRRQPDASGLVGNGEPFTATGSVPCALKAGQPTSSCRFGVIRTKGEGNAGVWIAIGEGAERYILFERGKPVFTNAQAKPALERSGDLNLVRIGDERFEIPDAVLNGG